MENNALVLENKSGFEAFYAADEEALGGGPIRRENLREQIADALQLKIQKSDLPAGARLPSERELAKYFKVNRNTIGDAIALLQQRGIVTRKQGHGTFTNKVQTSVVADCVERFFLSNKCSFQEIVTVRTILEPESAALAAQFSTAEEVMQIKDLAEKMAEAYKAKRYAESARHDTAFHEALGMATHNKLIMAFTLGLHQIVKSSVEATYSSEQTRREFGYLHHLEIAEAMAARNQEAARGAMQKHMRLLQTIKFGEMETQKGE